MLTDAEISFVAKQLIRWFDDETEYEYQVGDEKSIAREIRQALERAALEGGNPDAK